MRHGPEQAFDHVKGGERYQTEADYQREITNREKSGRAPLGHGLDLKCPHCVAGHRMPSRWHIEGPFGATVAVGTCECGQELRGDVIAAWEVHVRYAVPTDPRGRRVEVDA